jgi:voltage-gated potassium channel
VIFALEYLARLWIAVEVPFFARLGALRARLAVAKRPALVIDLLAILPSLLEFIGGFVGADLRVLRVLRLLRFFKLSRYSPAIHTIVRVLVNERRSLAGACFLMMAVLLVSSTVMYYLEHDAQPEKFSSIPAATYWAMTTLTTVGYGDLVPETPLGKLWAMLTMLMGVCTLALPVAIISTAFAQEAVRRDFVISWSMMSRIPLFVDLSTTEVNEIMPLLHALTFPPMTEVIPAGHAGDAMYFVAAGRVQAMYGARSKVYAKGDFFGSVALLNNDVSAGTYTTMGRCRLLKLHRTDLARLERVSPNVGRIIRLTAEARQKERAPSASSGAIDPTDVISR